MLDRVVKDEQIVLDAHKYIVSKTDAKGVINFVNHYFVKISGYEEGELMGKPHNIIRHPDMPRVIFKMMWERIASGENIFAVVKNLAKDGRYYWVTTDFEPRYDASKKEIEGYIAYRKAAPDKVIHAIAPLYTKLLEIEKEEGMEVSERYLNSFLEKQGLSYDEYIDDIIENKGVFKLFFNAMKKLFS